MFETFRIIVLVIWIVTAGGCAASGRFSPLRPIEQRLIYPRAASPTTPPAPSEGIVQARFNADDGVHLHGWFFEHPQPRAVVLFCHGNAGSVPDWSRAAKLLRDQHRVSVLLFDYRGYGQSEGTPDEQGILCDARAAREWLADRTGVAEHDIVLMGRSLGGAVAVDLAAEDGARGLVLDSTFSSLPDVAAHHMPWLLPRWNMTQRLNSADKIARYNGPLLQTHGDVDRVVPIQSARKLFDAAGEPKQFLVIPGADHNDPQNEASREMLDRFFDELPSVAKS
jgi:fermentation-respiration switch protein FrsA (DUF1100 family)